MGNFYTNFTLKTSDSAAVVAALKSAGRSAYVSPAADGYVVVFDEAADTQDTDVIEEVGTLLSGNVGCPALAVLNHDDDIFCYWLFDRGQQIDAYNSIPDYFDDSAGGERGGDVELLCTTLSVPAAAVAVNVILNSGDFTFALDQHEALADSLGLPEWTVGAGFTYIEAGDIPDGLEIDTLVRTP